MCKQFKIIQADNAADFEKALNSKLRELEKLEPEVEFNHRQGFCAYVIYSDNSDLSGIVDRPANVCICDSCLRLAETPRGRVKWRKCSFYGGAVTKTDQCENYIPGVIEYDN